jgi:hypothetical protein
MNNPEENYAILRTKPTIPSLAAAANEHSPEAAFFVQNKVHY